MPRPGFYSHGQETYFVTSTGKIYQTEWRDEADDPGQPRRVETLPDYVREPTTDLEAALLWEEVYAAELR